MRTTRTAAAANVRTSTLLCALLAPALIMTGTGLANEEEPASATAETDVSILGIELGMTPDAVQEILETKVGAKFKGHQFPSKVHRTERSLAGSTDSSAYVATITSNSTVEVRVEIPGHAPQADDDRVVVTAEEQLEIATARPAEELKIEFNGPPNDNVASYIERKTRMFPRPTRDQIVAGLEKRYGPPSAYHERGAHGGLLVWYWNAAGELEPAKVTANGIDHPCEQPRNPSPSCRRTLRASLQPYFQGVREITMIYQDPWAKHEAQQRTSALIAENHQKRQAEMQKDAEVPDF